MHRFDLVSQANAEEIPQGVQETVEISPLQKLLLGYQDQIRSEKTIRKSRKCWLVSSLATSALVMVSFWAVLAPSRSHAAVDRILGPTEKTLLEGT